MVTIFDQALVELDRMNTSASAPHSLDESKAKEMLKYLKSLGFPLPGDQIRKFGLSKGWGEEFTTKISGWADKINAGEEVIIAHPGYLTALFKNRLSGLF